MVEQLVKEQKTKALTDVLWDASNVLRNKMDASEYKNYLLSLVFFKYLSDNQLGYVREVLELEADNLEDVQVAYEKEDEETRESIQEALLEEKEYAIPHDLTFTALMTKINNQSFELADLAKVFREIEQSDEAFENLFEDVDLYSKKLGSVDSKRNATISDVMTKLSVLDLTDEVGDILGDAYEYLIASFASQAGKKAGEFYTPHEVSELMTRIALLDEGKKGTSLYDATMGSGSLLLNAKRYSKAPERIQYFGQELITSTYNLARMNMILHGVPVAHQNLRNGDTLDMDWPSDEPINFDAVLMNPPYSANWSATKGFLDDPRFMGYGGKLAPKSKADYAFLQHGLYHLKESGTMVIVLPHGVLFRGNAEGTIRKELLKKGMIDAVIGLPGGIFYSTDIPTTILILKKNRTSKDVLFIDASEEYTKKKAQNVLEQKHIDKIFDAYVKRENVDKFAHVAEFDEIKGNDYNLNIPRYVDTFEEEELIELEQVSGAINQTKAELKKAEDKLFGLLGQLEGVDDSWDNEFQAFLGDLIGGK